MEEFNTLQDEIKQLLGRNYSIESENRLQEYETNNKMIQGMMVMAVFFQYIGVRKTK